MKIDCGDTGRSTGAGLVTTGLAAASILLMGRSPAIAATLTATAYGATSDGARITRYTMTGRSGVRVSFISYGGIITQVSTPDRSGHHAPVTLGFATLRDYETIDARNEYYFGGILGRDTNWIKNGRFTLDGHAYQITLSDPPNTIHGGARGFDKRVWAIAPLASSGPMVAARLTYSSPDGEEGFPGTVKAAITYSLSDDGTFTIRYQASTDKASVVNLSSHMSFNLAGAGSPGGILAQVLTVDAENYLPLDAQQIPLGALRPLAGTVFDFRQPHPIGARIHDRDAQLRMADGYDQYWVLTRRPAAGLRRATHVLDPASGRVLEVWTTQLGVQIYTGGFFSGQTAGIGGRYAKYAAFTMETQGYPEAINHPNFPSAILRPGQQYDTTTQFRFSVAR